MPPSNCLQMRLVNQSSEKCEMGCYLLRNNNLTNTIDNLSSDIKSGSVNIFCNLHLNFNSIRRAFYFISFPSQKVSCCFCLDARELLIGTLPQINNISPCMSFELWLWSEVKWSLERNCERIRTVCEETKYFREISEEISQKFKLPHRLFII